MTSSYTFIQTYNVHTALWAAGRLLCQVVLLLVLLVVALWAVRWVISGSALVVGAGALLLANPMVVACLAGIAVYAYVTYPRKAVRYV